MSYDIAQRTLADKKDELAKYDWVQVRLLSLLADCLGSLIWLIVVVVAIPPWHR